MQILLHWSQHTSYSKTILCRLQLHFNSQRFITKLKPCSPTEKLGLLTREGQAIQLQASILSLKIYTIIHLFLACPLPLILPCFSSFWPNSFLITTELLCVHPPLPESFFTLSALQLQLLSALPLKNIIIISNPHGMPWQLTDSYSLFKF